MITDEWVYKKKYIFNNNNKQQYLLYIASEGAVGCATSITSLSPIAMYNLSDSGGGDLKSCSVWLVKISKPSLKYVCHGGFDSFSD